MLHCFCNSCLLSLFLPPVLLLSPSQDSDVERDSERDYGENSDSATSDFGEKKKKKKHKEKKEKKTKKKKKEDTGDSTQEETTKVTH